MGKLINLAGQQFGYWKVLERDLSKSGPRAYWKCICIKCNKTIKSIRTDHLKATKGESCGCLNDLTNQVFGKLTVLQKNYEYSKKHRTENTRYLYWDCLCSCGKITTVPTNKLRNGEVQSCGCLNLETITKDLTGQNFEKLTALYPTKNRKNHCIVWHCKCECGNECDVTTSDLICNRVKSCGCLKFKSLGEEKIIKVLQKNNIKYEKEKTFEDCINPKTGYKLRYDFYLPDYNCLIEFDGKQHYNYTTSNKSWNNKENFEKTQQRDQIKNEYAKSNNIKLIRIPYWEINNITLTTLLEKE